ncbi:MAG: DUF6263 family protein, partial [Planctomycetota bacterium]
MIKFVCILCHEKLSAPDQYAGKRIKCPKCNNTSIVPAESPTIRFTCKNCGKGIRVLQIFAGKQGKCPGCKSAVAVPPLSADPADGSETVTVVCAMCNEKIRTPKGAKERFIECPACGSNVETTVGAEPPEADSAIAPDVDEDEYEEEYEDESDLPEEGAGSNRRLILLIAGAAAVIIVGLIVLVTVILPSGSEPTERVSVSPRRTADEAEAPATAPAPDARPAGTFALEPPAPRAAAGDAASNAGLRLRLKRGDVRNVRLIKQDKVSQTLMGQQQDFGSTKTTELSLDVERVDANGVARLKVTYLAIKEKGQGAAAQMQYDSTTPDVPTEYGFAPMYSAMIGQSFQAKVTPEGIITGLEGVGEMYLAMAETIVQGEDEAARKRISERTTEGVEDKVRRSIERANERHGSRQKRVEVVRDMLVKNPIIAEGQIAEMVGDLIMVNPGRVVETGDSWQAKKALFSQGNVDVDCTYTLKEKTPTVMVVAVSSRIELDNELVSSENSSLGSAWTNLAGSYEGTLQIDPGSGWMIRKKATMRCSGEVRTPSSEQVPRAVALPVTMESIITVEPADQPAGTLALESPKEDVAVIDSAGTPGEARDDVRNLDLKLSLKPGLKRRLRLLREYNSSYTVGGQPRDNNGRLTTELEFEVKQVDPNGVMSLKVTHLRFHEITERASGQSEYDSAKPDTLGNTHFGPIFSAMIGQSFVVKVTPQGEMLELDGLNEMYQQMAEPLVEYEDEATRQTYDGESAKRRMDAANQKHGSRQERIEATREKLPNGPYSREENIRDMLDDVIMSFPGGPVEIGDSWTATPFSVGNQDLGDHTYTLRENNQAAVLVDISSKVELDEERPASTDGSRGPLRTTLAGSGQGSLEIDPGTGWMLRKNWTLRYSGEM